MHSLELRTVIKSTLIIIVGTALLGYVVFQARFLLIGPVIALDPEPSFTYNNRIITISGHAQNAAKLTLNGREIYTDEHGVFTEPLVLENDYTIMTIRAEDRYGRERTLSRSVVYRPISSLNM